MLSPGSRFNVICGRNGSGKTSLLEAINMLCLARSFRSHRLADVVRYGQPELMVTGRLRHRNGETVQVGVRKTNRDTEIRFGGQPIYSTSDLARHLPVILLTPDSHVDLFSGPKERRRVLDMTLFHVKPGYLESWKRYLRCLKHRNQLLRQRSGRRDIRSWDQQLVKAAVSVHKERIESANQLQSILKALLSDGFGSGLEVRYDAGWDVSLGYEATLENSLDGDISLGYTRYGPHRADIVLLDNGTRIDRSYSRGQLKLATASLLMAEAHLVARETGVVPLLLVDDLVSDLDQKARARLIRMLGDSKAQVFMTTIDPAGVLDAPGLPETVLFHVEQGAVQLAA